MPLIVTIFLSLDEKEQLIPLTKYVERWRERQRAQTILWLSEGKVLLKLRNYKVTFLKPSGYNISAGNHTNLN